MPENRNKLKHIKLRDSGVAERYKPINTFGPSFSFPTRPRKTHANRLLKELRKIKRDIPNLRQKIVEQQLEAKGIFLEFSSQPGYELALEKLDIPSKGIELVSVKTQEIEPKKTQEIATVFVPDDKVSYFISRIEQYRDEDLKSNKPKNQPLVNSIESIRLAVIKSFWTDSEDLFPSQNEKIWWEIWLRSEEGIVERFQSFANARQIAVGQGKIEFPDRTVILAYGNVDQLSDSIEAVGLIAELRRAKETTSEFLDMYPNEQREWIDAAMGLLNPPTGNEATVCLFDTGVSRQHRMIGPFLSAEKTISVIPSTSGDDHDGHGTGMAGLVLYSDINRILTGTTRFNVPCNIESVKILPPPPNQNDPKLYGNLTEEAVSQVTSIDPLSDRILLMAVTALNDRDRGRPSSWSAAIDKICTGQTVTDTRHLFILSSGNCPENAYPDFPSSNEIESIHDPAQSWNALTVGAFTEKVDILDPAYSSWKPISEVGDIAPSNSTSLTWEQSKWPIKPDVVFEGGNVAIEPTSKRTHRPDSMILLTTNRILPGGTMFTWIADTSAASALAANFAAQLANLYPNFWPETLRALIIHSATWTPKMLSRYRTFTRREKENLLRVCGYGVPNLDRALHSASDYLTLIVEDSIQPFEDDAMNEIKFHNLPWPKEALESLGDTEIEMRVTLSYFVEPSPAGRGWSGKYRYQSHGLRFDMKTSEETYEMFNNRINKASWDEEQGRPSHILPSDAEDWYLGPQIRSRGSVHSDYWRGPASKLAQKDQLAVYPVIGWWREKHRDGHTEKSARYSLVVSIKSPEVEVDIYTPVENSIAVTV